MPPNPATMRERFKRIAYRYRHIPGDYGLRIHTIEWGVGSWTGPETGDGVGTIVWTRILEGNGQPPKILWLTNEQLALGGLPGGSCTVGPITPNFFGGGTSADTLSGDGSMDGQTFKFRITGPRHPDSAIYVLHEGKRDRALHYTLTLKPLVEVPSENG